MITIDDFKAKVLGVEYGELCKYTVELSYTDVTIVVTHFQATDQFSLGVFLKIWFKSKEALNLFGHEKEVRKYAAKNNHRTKCNNRATYKDW